MKKNAKILIGAAVVIGVIFMSQKKAIADAITKNSDSFTKWDPLFRAAAMKYGINWKWVKAIAWNESSLGSAKSVARGLATPSDVEGSKSSDGLSWGIMQTTLSTAREMRPGTTVQDLNNPSISIDLGARYLSQMLKRYKNDLNRAVRAYNQGPGNEDKRKPYADVYLTRFLDHLQQVEERQP